MSRLAEQLCSNWRPRCWGPSHKGRTEVRQSRFQNSATARPFPGESKQGLHARYMSTLPVAKADTQLCQSVRLVAHVGGLRERAGQDSTWPPPPKPTVWHMTLALTSQSPRKTCLPSLVKKNAYCVWSGNAPHSRLGRS